MGREKVKGDPYLPAKPGRTDWGTPDKYYQPLHREFKFTLDAAASKDNTKCEKFYDEEADGTKQPWKGHTVFWNPPYTAELLKAFTRKAILEARENGVTSVGFLPAKTDQPWWHWIWACYLGQSLAKVEIRWIKGRVKYVGAEHGATFPTVVVIVHGKKKKKKRRKKCG